MSMIHIASSDTKSKFDTDFEDICVQPNAYDIRLDKVYRFVNTDAAVFKVNEYMKQHREFEEVSLNYGDLHWHLNPGVYQITIREIIEIGEGEAGFVITRSTLNRNGVFLTSGLYDSGYHGVMAAAMHVTTGRMIIAPGTRVGQFILFKSETLNMYDGSYGINKEYDKRYK